jgi:hypothetical protein
MERLAIDYVCSLQYTCMFISAGEPGNAKKIQASVAAARKVFRVFGVRMLFVFACKINQLAVFIAHFFLLSLCPCLLRSLSLCCLLQPLESVSPIILNPHLNPKKPLYIELLNKV